MPTASARRIGSPVGGWLLASLVLAELASASSASAAEPKAALSTARVLYDQGKIAYDAKSFAEAASAFSRADELVPNPTVLAFAITSAEQAGDAPLGMTLVDRAQRRGLTDLVQTNREKFAGRVGRFEVTCPATLTCSAKLDGHPVVASEWTTVGDHSVELDADGTIERFTITVTASQVAMVRPTRVLRIAAPAALASTAAPVSSTVPTPPTPPPPESDRRVLAPGWFTVAAGATVLAAGATALAGADTLSQHADFERDPTNRSAGFDGRAAQTRTNVLLGTTVVLAVGTAVIGIFFTRWSSKGRSEVAHAL